MFLLRLPADIGPSASNARADGNDRTQDEERLYGTHFDFALLHSPTF